MIEHSLSKYLQYLYIEFPGWVNIRINGSQVNKLNPYSQLKSLHSNAFIGEKGDKYAIQILNSQTLKENIASMRDRLAHAKVKIENPTSLLVEEGSTTESPEQLEVSLGESLSNYSHL